MTSSRALNILVIALSLRLGASFVLAVNLHDYDGKSFITLVRALEPLHRPYVPAHAVLASPARCSLAC